MPDLRAEFGDIDIYLFDQLLRGRLCPGMRVIDAGCGSGRNLVYLLRNGYDVRAADADPHAIATVRDLAARLAPSLPAANFRVEAVEAMTFADGSADVVISSAVLHFARDAAHFDGMLEATWRVLRPNGLFFCRLASSIGMTGMAGMAERLRPLGNGRFILPDRSERYLVDEARLMAKTKELGGALIDPIKTTIVQEQRCMTTWVMTK